MKLLILAAAAAAALAIGQEVQPPDPWLFATARRLLDQQLLDYPSARFRDVHANGPLACGFVNAKNRLGAYSGWQRFAVLAFEEDGADPALYLDQAGGSAGIMLDTFCGEDGTRIKGPDFTARMHAR